MSLDSNYQQTKVMKYLFKKKFEILKHKQKHKYKRETYAADLTDNFER